MTIYLNKDQMRTVQLALENYSKTLKTEIKDKAPSIRDLIEPELFQIELLATWFERQREMQS